MARILDRFGRPIETHTLPEAQTAQVSSLHHTTAEHPVRGLTPQKLSRILEAAERGDLTAQHALFEDMEERDAHLFAEMSKRKRALQTVPWSIEPPPNPSKDELALAAQVQEWFEAIPDFEDVLFDMADAIGHGWVNLEIQWQKLGRDWLPVTISHRPHGWFQLHPDEPNELRLRDNTLQGGELWPFGWIRHVHRAKSGYVARCGLHRILTWPFIFKAYSTRDLAEFLEIYGLPLRLGKYPNGASKEEKATLLRAVVAIGHDAAGIIPAGMDIEFMEAAKGSSDPFQAMIEWAEKSVSKAILGGTLTSQADGKTSTHALGNVHNEVRHDLRTADCRQIASTLKRDLIYPLCALNRGTVDFLRLPSIRFKTTEPADLALYADALPKLVDVGLDIPQDWARETLNIPAPLEGQPVLARSKPAGAVPPAAAAKLAALSASIGAATATPEQQLQQLLSTATQDGLIRPIAELLAEVDTLEQLRDRLVEVYGQMDAAHFAVVMEQALQAAVLAGRYEVLNG